MDTHGFSGLVKNCRDSHVHWLATGQFSKRVSLHNLKSEMDILNLAVDPYWLMDKKQFVIGFGWDQNLFANKKYPSRQSLDKKFGDQPVYFTRIDGHAAWVNTETLKRSGLWRKNIPSPQGGRIELDDDGWPTGILIDLAMPLVSEKFPEPTHQNLKDDLLLGQTVFHNAGFTHIRDLSCDIKQWQAATELEHNGQLKLAVEQFFSAENPSAFHERLNLAVMAKSERHHLLRPCGVKVYMDGALGSEGALLSKPYCSGHNHGLQMVDDSVIREMMIECWKNGVDIAVHVIGDRAAHSVVEIAFDLVKRGINGCLHLEHAELLRPDTIQLMKMLNVKVHMQPCHWLSDSRWLAEKVGELYKFAFQWRALEVAEIPFDFGSDTPIERPSVQDNYLAIHDANRKQIPAIEQSFVTYHSHSDALWTPDTYSEFKNGQLQSLYFLGEALPISKTISML